MPERMIAPGEIVTLPAPSVATTLGVLAVADPALGRLLAQKLPLARAYAVATLARAVRLELEFYNATRESLLKECGILVEGAMWKIMPDHLEEWLARIGELHAIPVRLAVTPLDLTDWTIEITGEDLLALGPLVVTHA